MLPSVAKYSLELSTPLKVQIDIFSNTIAGFATVVATVSDWNPASLGCDPQALALGID